MKYFKLSSRTLPLTVSNRLGPLLNVLKLRKSQDGLESLSDTLSTSVPTTPLTPLTPTIPLMQNPPVYSLASSSASSCVTLNILAEPPPGTPIRADIVLIHGLHGSLINTWKQGLWQNERHPVEFDRPPRPPVRPPKRPRHSRSAAIHLAPREKRAKFTSCRRETEKQDEAHNDSAWELPQMQQAFEQKPPHSNASDTDDAEGWVDTLPPSSCYFTWELLAVTPTCVAIHRTFKFARVSSTAFPHSVCACTTAIAACKSNWSPCCRMREWIAPRRIPNQSHANRAARRSHRPMIPTIPNAGLVTGCHWIVRACESSLLTTPLTSICGVRSGNERSRVPVSFSVRVKWPNCSFSTAWAMVIPSFMWATPRVACSLSSWWSMPGSVGVQPWGHFGVRHEAVSSTRYHIVAPIWHLLRRHSSRDPWSC